MFKRTFPAMLLLLGGCIGDDFSPGKLPAGASAGIYTNMPQRSVAECLAVALQARIRSEADRLIVESQRHPGLRYAVEPNGRSTVYPTQVAVIGREADDDEAKAVSACIVPQADVSSQ